MDEVDIESLEVDTDVGLNPELDLNFDVDTLSINEGNLASLDPVTTTTVEFDQSSRHSSENSDTHPNSHKPYHSKRPHKKSRAGCQQCKKRKVKCDEVRPTCKACRLRKEKCVYPATQSSTHSAYSPTSTSAKEYSSSIPGSTPDSGYASVKSSPQIAYESAVSSIVAEPLFRPGEMSDALDMKMLWFYTTTGFQFFSIQSGRSAFVDNILKVKVVQQAFQSPFLMDCLMAVSSLHLQTMGQPVPPRRAANYCAKAFEGYRNAIEAANPADFTALIPCSLLMVALSSQMFRDPDAKRLYIVDWMQVWKGMGLIIDIVTHRVLQQSGMAVLFYRPAVDLEKSTKYIPNNLLFMVASITAGDTDEDEQQTYYDMLKYLGSLYQEMKEHGFSSILDLRIITFYTFVPKPFIPLAKEHRPRALIILAYHLCFAKLCPDLWWLHGIADRQIKQIIESVGEEWAHLLRVPRMILDTENRTEIAQLLVDNHNWTPTEKNQYERDRDPRLKTDVKLIDNLGSELGFIDGGFRQKAAITSTELDVALRAHIISSGSSVDSPYDIS
ncbi:uncharacterized protein F4822DRAFT_248252 [Hypoxylon trugodes]|uniref:uncharacterized protein n=1 Tax=Hypoxylon trugodes TaxID=326681 RepID=UPI0021967681|nr:uncharacterized protein F4822DRAFT_248252 [Hypoxylon trugodes]KAI1388497.1 hypothetical protein F4822DRAFT_248252 [Hypoxylon trugodes]